MHTQKWDSGQKWVEKPLDKSRGWLASLSPCLVRGRSEKRQRRLAMFSERGDTGTECAGGEEASELLQSPTEGDAA